ncbi:TniQ family protein [Cohnella phaseoli]|uniref:TniQ protein n=1 Tax=Cohnella phaseoli TaxID=456490 RepID=A0A3D9KS03_9BACL|nr:TniQ family protein [Cohnella phaseoli]RED89174.1 TniQ protein [Cohnella phaseoli]
MHFLFLPTIKSNESLISYLNRIANVNHYLNSYQITDALKMNHNTVRTNHFTSSEITLLSKLIDMPSKKAVSMTSNYFEMLMGKQLSNKMVLKSKFKFCPLCITKDSIYQISWFLRSITICTKHQVVLCDHCKVCGSNVSVESIMANSCKYCDHAYSSKITTKDESKEWANHKVFDCADTGVTRFMGYNMTFKNIHQLLYSSTLFLEGCPSPLIPDQVLRIFHNRRSGMRDNVSYYNAIKSFFWMYDQFPSNFYRILDYQLKLPAKSMYYRTREFEKLFGEEAFNWIKSAYEYFWLTKLDEGRVRKDMSVFKNNTSLLEQRGFIRKEEAKNYFSNEKLISLVEENLLILKENNKKYLVDKKSLNKHLDSTCRFVSKVKCSQLLGLNTAIVYDLIEAGILHEDSIGGAYSKLIRKDEIDHLLGKCLATIDKIDERWIPFRKALRKYNTVGLSAIFLIKKILVGKLVAVNLNTIGSFKSCYVDRNQLLLIIKEMKERRSVEKGLYREEIMKILKIGEKAVASLESSGQLKPKQIVQLKGGRKRYLYDWEKIMEIAQRNKYASNAS